MSYTEELRRREEEKIATQKLMMKKIKEGGGIFAGVPATLDREGHIIDQYGRRLETVAEAKERRKEELHWSLKLFCSTTSEDIEDPCTGNIMIPEGTRLSVQDVRLLLDTGLCLEKLYKNKTIEGSHGE